jgi:hypothetical protein
MLLDSLHRADIAARADYADAVKDFRRKAGVIDWDRVSMTPLIAAAEKLGLLQSAPSRMAEGARDLRDTVHPNAEVRLGTRANAEEAELLLVLVRLIYRDLST